MLDVPHASDERAAIRALTYADEAGLVRDLVARAGLDAGRREAIVAKAAGLVEAVRERASPTVMEAFLAEYGLSTNEGVALMCLAEALLRVPDAETMDDLIADKIAPHRLVGAFRRSSSIFVNASTWALMLTGRVLDESRGRHRRHAALDGAAAGRAGDPHGGRAGDEADGRAVRARPHHRGARSSAGAGRGARAISIPSTCWARRPAPRPTRCAIATAYAEAIAALGTRGDTADVRDNPGISVKLSALHPRYEWRRTRAR